MQQRKVLNIARQLNKEIARRKQAEEAKLQLETRLYHAQKREAVGILAAGIAHDFNNLLMCIGGHASLMLTDISSDHPQFRNVREIKGMVKKGAKLTKQLLGLVKGGKYEVKPTDLNKLINKSSMMFGRIKKEITIHGKYQKDLRTVEIDQGQIEQSLLNLYINAWHAMPKGGDLYIQTDNVTLDKEYVKPFNVEQGHYVRISVGDTGVGMDEDAQRRVFEPFFTDKDMSGGTGLGLASAYGIIKNHGGIINVYSKKGEGTTFNIYLPAMEGVVSEDPVVIEEEIQRGDETILLVDDEDMIVDVGREILTAIGYRVLLARSGKEAIKVYKKNKGKIDLLILDMVMPGTGGGEVYDTIKEINPNVKVLLSSGYGIEGKAEEILKRGCDGFIQKPFNMNHLLQSIRRILGKK